MARLVLLADTHNHRISVPPGDVLIVAGDLTMGGTIGEMSVAATWLHRVCLEGSFKAALIICGNHDWLGYHDQTTTRLLFEEKGLTYLHDQATTIDGINFYGSPYTPRFMDWAFNVDRGPDLARIWSRIPDDTHVLITHGPPMGILDSCERMDVSGWECPGRDLTKFIEHVGCADLKARIAKLKSLRLHVFGHVHRPGTDFGADGTRYINATIVNESYNPVYSPAVLDLDI